MKPHFEPNLDYQPKEGDADGRQDQTFRKYGEVPAKGVQADNVRSTPIDLAVRRCAR